MGCGQSSKKDIIPPVNKVVSKEELKINAATYFTIQTKRFQTVYSIGELIGESLSSEIRSCIHKETKTKRAVKVIRKTVKTSKKEEINREIEILKTLDHPNILRLFELYEDEKRFYIVTESLRGRELFEEILSRGAFNENDTASIIHQLLSAVNYLHMRKVAHRDLKPENILLEGTDNLNITLIDFGSATPFGAGRELRGTIGSTYYISPEVLTGAYNEKCDIWSCGVILYILIAGSAPFDGKSETEIFGRIRSGAYNMDQPVWQNVTSEAKELIRGLLAFNPDVRMSASAALEHPWFTMYHNHSLGQSALTSVMTNLKAFHNSTKLKDAVFTFITTNLLTAQDTQEMREAFRVIDKNNDGKLSREELLEAYTKQKGSEEEAAVEVNRIFNEVDTDHSGFIDYTEFLKATVDHSKMLSATNLEQAFSIFDSDGSGTISASELKRVLMAGSTADDAVWTEIMREVDSSGDGEIDVKEFKDLLINKLR
jgi:calcium-dependent protein kinase